MPAIDLTTYGYFGIALPGELMPARVTAAHRERYELITPLGPAAARLKSGVYYKEETPELYPTVGDFVLIEHNPLGDSTIVETLPRRSIFMRADGFSIRGSQAVAANFDYVFIMCSMNQDFNLRRIERYLAVAWETGGTPIVVLTKADLVENPDEFLLSVQNTAPGVEVFAVSARTGFGMAQLHALLSPGVTVAFLGMSGVGKSSLLNALYGDNIMSVKEIREDDARGRHTTTHRQLIMLPSGAMIIDTPGMRELGMSDSDGSGVAELYADIDELIAACRFNDCTHKNEPGCAIRAALEAGELTQKRYEGYQKLAKEAAYAADRAAFMRKRQAFHKELAKYQKARTKKR